MYYRIILLSIIMLFSALTFAQGTTERAKDRATQRAEQRANSRLDQKVDQGVDKAIGAIEGLFKKKKKNKGTDEAADGNAKGGGDADEYAAASVLGALTGGGEEWESFENDQPFSLTMTVTEIKKNGKSTTNVMHLGATRNQLAIVGGGEEEESYQMILDTETGKTTMVTTDKKGNRQGYRMRMPNIGKMAGEITDDMKDYIKMTRTGERKNIDGYDCELILVEDTKHNTTTRSWVTTDLPLSYTEVFGAMAGFSGAGKMKLQTPAGTEVPLEGMLIFSTTEDGNKTYETHITNIKVGEDAMDRSLFDTGDAEIQELGF